MSFQNLVRLSQIKKFSLCLITPMSTKCQKNEKKIDTINVIQHDDRLWYLRLFYNGAFSVVSKHDFDDQFFLLATVNHSLLSKWHSKVKFWNLFSVHVKRMSVKIVANGKIVINNVKPILHFLTVQWQCCPKFRVSNCTKRTEK
jgi:hypothetical protein